MTPHNRTYFKFEGTPENAYRQMARGLIRSQEGGVYVPILHKRHHVKRWDKSLFQTNRKQWLELQALYIRGE